MSEKSLKLVFDKNALSSFCRGKGIRKLAIFGSATRADFSNESDVDVVVDFRSDSIPSLFDLPEIVENLSRIFNHPVDLITYKSLKNPYFRDQVLAEQKVQYDEDSAARFSLFAGYALVLQRSSRVLQERNVRVVLQKSCSLPCYFANYQLWAKLGAKSQLTLRL